VRVTTRGMWLDRGKILDAIHKVGVVVGCKGGWGCWEWRWQLVRVWGGWGGVNSILQQPQTERSAS